MNAALSLTLHLLLPLALVADSRPPVLVFSIDDLNDWVGCLGGHPQAQTPNIDRLAARGTLFTNAHCQAPVCTPSRASLITGLYPSTSGLYFLRPGLEASEIAKKHPHILETFQAAGYHTLGAGKFVHTQEDKYFETYGGGMGGFGPIPDEKITYPDGLKLWDWGAYPETDEETPDWKVADWVIDQLQQEHEKPFFLVAGFWRPHVPMYAPQHWHDQFPLDEIQLPETLASDREDLPAYAKDLTHGEPAPRHIWFLENNAWHSAVQSYLASVAFVDSQVGRVLDALDASPYADEAIIVLFSDHGWHLGEKQRWAKRSLWNDGTHVPLIISAPGLPAGKRCAQPAGLIDIYPTLMELTGIPAPGHLEGLSLTPQLKDATTVREQPSLCTFGPNNHSLHFERWHYIHYADGSKELYDLETDPHEWENLAGKAEHQKRILGYQTYLPKNNAEVLIDANWKDPWELGAWQTAEENAKRAKP